MVFPKDLKIFLWVASCFNKNWMNQTKTKQKKQDDLKKYMCRKIYRVVEKCVDFKTDDTYNIDETELF